MAISNCLNLLIGRFGLSSESPDFLLKSALMRVLFITLLLFSYSGQNQNQAKDQKHQTGNGAEAAANRLADVKQIPSPTATPTPEQEKPAAKPESKPWLSHGELVMSILTCVYVLLTLAYVIISARSLKAIKKQADLTEKQGESSTEQFNKQLAAMNEAREQTNKLIEQATAQAEALTQQARSTAHLIGQAARQADALHSLVSATRKSADAAGESAAMAASNVLALMNAERAWIMAEIQWRANMHVVKHSDSLSLDIFLLYQNDGKTPAWITEVRILFRIIDAQPVKPLYGTSPGDFAISGPIPVTIGEKGKIKAWLQCEGIQEGKTLIVYGFIKYRDVFSPDRETRFGYKVIQSGFNRIAEIGDSWHYNGYT